MCWDRVQRITYLPFQGKEIWHLKCMQCMLNHGFYKRNHFSLISPLILHSYPIHSPLKRFMATHASFLKGQLRTPWDNCLLNSVVTIYLDHRILPLFCALDLIWWLDWRKMDSLYMGSTFLQALIRMKGKGSGRPPHNLSCLAGSYLHWSIWLGTANVCASFLGVVVTCVKNKRCFSSRSL